LDNAFLIPKEFVQQPEAGARIWSPAESLAYTSWLARYHYENFPVVSFLLPKRLHQDFYNVYSFCRWADDLGDEIGDATESLRLLAWWREQLDALYAGAAATHPVFVALAGTVERHHLPREPFADLIAAFEQDQRVSRYRNLDELLSYCRYSANPVGRLVLYLCGYSDPERQRLSDATCTGLQLANFWQDVAVDWKKDRVYIPLDALEKHGASAGDIRRGEASPGFRAALEEMVGVARECFRTGAPLAGMVDRRLALDLDLFNRGGMRVLDKIEQQGFDVLSRRPVVGKLDRALLLLSSLARVGVRRAS